MSEALATRRPTHEQRLLAILADNRWHSSAELYRRVPCIVHSRIAVLRRRGYAIEHKGGGGGADNHYYLLTNTTKGEAA